MPVFPGCQPSLTGGAFIETLFREDRGEVIDVDAVAHAGAALLDWRGDTAVAVVVTRRGVVQDSERDDLRGTTAGQLDDLVAVLCFSSVSVVHFVLYGWFTDEIRRLTRRYSERPAAGAPLNLVLCLIEVFTEEFRFVTAAAFAALTVCQRDSMGVFASQPVSVLIDETLLRKFPRRGFGIVCNLAPHHGIKVARPADFAPAW